jgi:hypothetical protein
MTLRENVSKLLLRTLEPVTSQLSSLRGKEYNSWMEAICHRLVASRNVVKTAAHPFVEQAFCIPYNHAILTAVGISYTTVHPASTPKVLLFSSTGHLPLFHEIKNTKC